MVEKTVSEIVVLNETAAATGTTMPPIKKVMSLPFIPGIIGRETGFRHTRKSRMES
jgi:hypothetical protein